MSLSATCRLTGSVCSAIQTVAHAALADLLQRSLYRPGDGGARCLGRTGVRRPEGRARTPPVGAAGPVEEAGGAAWAASSASTRPARQLGRRGGNARPRVRRPGRLGGSGQGGVEQRCLRS